MATHDATDARDKWARLYNDATVLRSQAIRDETEFYLMARQAALTAAMFSPEAPSTAARAVQRADTAMRYLQMLKRHIDADPTSALVSVALLTMQTDLARTRLMLS